MRLISLDRGRLLLAMYFATLESLSLPRQAQHPSVDSQGHATDGGTGKQTWVAFVAALSLVIRTGRSRRA